MSVKFHIRSTTTGLWLISPVDGWPQNAAAWTDIREAAYQFSPKESQSQLEYLSYKKLGPCKRARVPKPHIPAEKTNG